VPQPYSKIFSGIKVKLLQKSCSWQPASGEFYISPKTAFWMFDARDCLSDNPSGMKIQHLKANITMAMSKSFLLRMFSGWSFLLYLAACGNNSINVEDLVATAPEYNGRIITVS
jgi:hypothetical protein